MPHRGTVIKPINLLLNSLCSILYKKAELEHIVVQKVPHVLTVAESWLHSDADDPAFMLSDYTLLRQDR